MTWFSARPVVDWTGSSIRTANDNQYFFYAFAGKCILENNYFALLWCFYDTLRIVCWYNWNAGNSKEARTLLAGMACRPAGSIRADFPAW